MRALLLVTVVLLAGCGGGPDLIDAATEPDAGLAPVCRHATEAPASVCAIGSDCDYYVPTCPTGYAAVCPREGSGWVLREPYGCIPPDDGTPNCPDATTLPTCADGLAPVCYPPSFSLEDPQNPGHTCGERCNGWVFADCWNPNA